MFGDMNHHTGIDTKGGNLIFLVSQPRSGSTLLQRILAGHEGIATTSEPWIALHPLYALRDKGVQTEYDWGDAREGLRAFLKESGLDENDYRAQIASFLLALYNRGREEVGALYFLDKTPRYYNIIPEISQLFPGAKFILLFRNPLAVLNSILKTWVRDDLWKLNRFSSDLLEAPQKLLEAARRLPERSVTLRFEDLVERPEATLKRICAFLGITYSETLLTYGNRAGRQWRLGDTDGIDKYDSPNIEPLESWKKGFETQQMRHLAHAYISQLGSSAIEAMGYRVEEMTGAVKPPERDGDIVPWSFLMRKNEDLLDQIEFDLYRYPEHMGEIAHRYIRLHHTGLLGKMARAAVNVVTRAHRLAARPGKRR